MFPPQDLPALPVAQGCRCGLGAGPRPLLRLMGRCDLLHLSSPHVFKITVPISC